MAGGFLSRISSQTITNTRWYLAGSNAETGNDRSIAESFRVHQKFFSNLGSKAEFADVSGGLAENGDEFLADLLNKELVHFGVITQICHGSFIRKNDGSFISLYNVYDFVRDNKTMEQAVSDLELQNEQEFLDNFYTEHIEDVAENTGIFVNATSFWISSNLYRHVYQNCFFDNTIIYFGSCFGMLDQSLVDFFLDHGVRMIMGYETPCHADAESVRFVNAFNQLFGTNTHAGESGVEEAEQLLLTDGWSKVSESKKEEWKLRNPTGDREAYSCEYFVKDDKMISWRISAEIPKLFRIEYGDIEFMLDLDYKYRG